MNFSAYARFGAAALALGLLSGCVPQQTAGTSEPWTLSRTEGAEVTEQGLIHIPNGLVEAITQRRTPVKVVARPTGDLSSADLERMRAAAVSCSSGEVSGLDERQERGAWVFSYNCLKF